MLASMLPKTVMANGDGMKRGLDAQESQGCERKRAREATDAVDAMLQSFQNQEALSEKVKLYRQQVESMKDPKAMCKLGECLFNGNGIKQDVSEAVKWFSEAE